jgi:hypothetical protein
MDISKCSIELTDVRKVLIEIRLQIEASLFGMDHASYIVLLSLCNAISHVARSSGFMYLERDLPCSKYLEILQPGDAQRGTRHASI